MNVRIRYDHIGGLFKLKTSHFKKNVFALNLK